MSRTSCLVYCALNMPCIVPICTFRIISGTGRWDTHTGRAVVSFSTVGRLAVVVALIRASSILILDGWLPRRCI